MLHSASPYWKQQGLQCEILAVGSARGSYASALEEAGYRVYYIPFSPSYLFLREIWRFLLEQRYDAVHIHLERANFWYAILAYFARTRKIAYTSHGLFRFTGGLRLERSVQRWIMRKLLGVQMISISESSERCEREQFGNHTITIHNWFDSDKFTLRSAQDRFRARTVLGFSDEVTVITSIGGCWPYKNHSVILEAMSRIPASIPLLYVHVGQEEAGFPERKRAGTLGIIGRVRFLGIVPDVLPILQASDLYVMPSTFEGFGIAAAEAMGAGLPAILSGVPGLSDFRDAGDGIYWVEPTPESVAKAIFEFLEVARPDRLEVGKHLSEYVHERFSAEQGARAYSQLYQ